MLRWCAGITPSKALTKRFYSFLASGRISSLSLTRSWIKRLGDRMQVEGRTLVALDDTMCPKTGKHIHGVDSHFDHASKINQSTYLWGHCRVVVGLVLHIHGRWACLPMLQGLYRPRSKRLKEEVDRPNPLPPPPSTNRYGTRRAKRKHHRKERYPNNKLDLAAGQLAQLMDLLKGSILVVCDSWFGNGPFYKKLQAVQEGRFHLLSRLRKQCALYELPPPKKGGVGRRKKYGRRLKSLERLATSYERKSASIFIYGSPGQVTYSEVVCTAKFIQRTIRVVFIHKSKGHFFPLFTTDLELSAEQMIAYYAARWKIEAGFKELKHELGALDNQARKAYSVENHFNLCCLAMSLVWVHTLEQKKKPHRRYAFKRRSYSFSDAREQIKKEYERQSHKMGFAPHGVKTAINYIWGQLFEVAA